MWLLCGSPCIFYIILKTVVGIEKKAYGSFLACSLLHAFTGGPAYLGRFARVAPPKLYPRPSLTAVMCSHFVSHFLHESDRWHFTSLERLIRCHTLGL